MKKRATDKKRSIYKTLGSLLLSLTLGVSGVVASTPTVIDAAPLVNEENVNTESSDDTVLNTENTTVATESIGEPSDYDETEAGSNASTNTTEMTKDVSEQPSLVDETTEENATVENTVEENLVEQDGDEDADAEEGADVTEGTDETEDGIIEGFFIDTVYPDVDLPGDSDTLFAGWAEQQFEESIEEATANEISTENSIRFPSMRASLTGTKGTYVQELKRQINTIAKNGGSSILTYDSNVEVTSVLIDSGLETNGQSAIKQAVAEEAKNTILQVTRQLLAECPYELYWYDKTLGVSYTTHYSYNNQTGECKISFPAIAMAVIESYRGEANSTYSASGEIWTMTVSKEKATLVQDVIANAQSVVNGAASLNDMAKLEAYKNYICDAVSYNTAAAKSSTIGYSDPWQLIYVFDNDSTTNVVCEGYSKAFAYLCQLTTFQDSNAEVRIVGGQFYTGSNDTTGEPHMWNVMYLNGINYLVDVTNTDVASTKNMLFMSYPDAGSTKGTYVKSTADEYAVQITGTSVLVKYVYGDSTKLLYTDAERTLGAVEASESSPEDTNLQFGGISAGIKVKTTPVYGDRWSGIITIVPSALTAKADSKTIAGTYKVINSTTIPTAGANKSWSVVFNSTDGTYKNVTVASGTVTVAKRPVRISWSNTSLTYNGATQKPTATVSNKVSTSDQVNVTVTGAARTVGTHTATAAALTGTTASNYTLTGGSNLTRSYTISQPSVSVFYTTHVQNIGWQNWVSNGVMAGTSGRSFRLEGLRATVSGNANLGIQYRTHVQNVGWQNWVSNGAMAGTSGRSLRLEAMQMQLTGSDADLYDIYYCVHVQNDGWQNWVKNGAVAGTAGRSLRLEGLMVQILPKGSAAPAYVGSGSGTSASVNYSNHVQNIGWQSYRSNGGVAGTSGQSLRLEGMKMYISGPTAGGIEYRTHVQNVGWQNWVSNNSMAGTSGRSLRLEAMQIRLTGAVAESYDVYYRVHVQNLGWLGWAKNGGYSGTAGKSLRLEAMQVVLVPKGGAAPGSTVNAFVQG